MYENITYQELKGLSDEQKKEALLELQSTFGDNKSIANSLGISMIAISNMIKKYVLGEHVGRKKNEATADAPKGVKLKRKYNKREKAELVHSEEAITDEVVSEKKSQCIFTIDIYKTLSGQNMQYLLNGLGNALIKDQDYILKITIEEK